MAANASSPVAGSIRFPSMRFLKKWGKRIGVFALAVYFIPVVLAVYVALGAIDFLRNRQRTFDMLDRYFAGNGFQAWILSPFNLLMDLLTLPYWNKKIYALADLPQGHQDEINSM